MRYQKLNVIHVNQYMLMLYAIKSLVNVNKQPFCRAEVIKQSTEVPLKVHAGGGFFLTIWQPENSSSSI